MSGSAFRDFREKKRKGLEFHDDKALKQEMLRREKSINRFPLHVFHESVHPMMQTLIEKFRLPPSYVGSSFLAAYSTAIGTAYTVSQNQKSDGMFMPIYLGLVGESSQGKSTAINQVFKPLQKISDQFGQDYDNDSKRMKDEERRESSFKDLIIRDIRVPTLLKDSLPANPKGVVKLQGEIIEWIKGMNPGGRKEGTDEEFWISTWNCDPYQKTLSGNNRFYVKSPFVNIIGGVQWEVIPEIFNGNRSTSGFAYRILFAVAEDDKVAWRHKGAYVPESHYNPHHDCIDRLYKDLPVRDGYDDPKRCVLTPESEDLHYEFFDDLRIKIDDMDIQLGRKARGIFGKMVEYSLRFAGILHLHRKACDPRYATRRDFDDTISFNDQEPITSDIMQHALELTSYFYKASLEVTERVEHLIIAPPEVLQIAGMLRNGKTYKAMLDVVYEDNAVFQAEKASNPEKCYQKWRKRLQRLIEKYQYEHPKAFGIWK